MKNINLKIIYFFLIANFCFSNLQSETNNNIEIKVGRSLITTLDIKNEVITNLVITNQEINQENIDSSKNYATRNLIRMSIKNNEISKYNVKNYSKKDLQNYITKIAKNLNTDIDGLKEIFIQHSINYDKFVEMYQVELKWNTLIFELYKNQTNINLVEVDNEIQKIKENKTKQELKEIKKKILNKKKEEKLNLFSRSHFSNLENTVIVKIQ
jgi:hypothetical protein